MLNGKSKARSILAAVAAVIIAIAVIMPAAADTYAATKTSSKTKKTAAASKKSASSKSRKTKKTKKTKKVKVYRAYAVILNKKASTGATYRTNVIYTAEKVSGSEIESDIAAYVKQNTKNAVSASLDENSSITVKRYTSKMNKSEFAKANDFAAKTTYRNKLRDKTKPDKAAIEDMIIKGKYIDVVADTYTKEVTYQDYNVIKKKSARYRKSTKVTKGGVKGTTTIETYGREVNGVEVSKPRVEKTVVKPVDKVIYTGTAMMPITLGQTYTGTDGADVVKYAKKFIGNPYVWGGTSLTKGADCSGFIYSIYRHFGLSVPRVCFYRVGKQVCSGKNFDVKKLKPGDVITYSGHYALYAGDGMVVHAASPKWGIVYTKIDWSGTPIEATRFFE
ncbi:MAG: C40 family peptidase [Anaerovoracaceae bacterium]